MLLFERISRFGKPLLILTLTFCCFFIWQLNLVEGAKVLRVAFLDVGQGDSIYIEAPNGNQLLIDGGGNGKVLERLNEEMVFGDRTINVVVATHPDKDHIGGLADVIERYEVENFIESGAVNDTAVFKRLEALIEDHSILRHRAQQGMVIDLGGGVTFSVLYPSSDVSRIKEINDASIVGILEYGKTRLLLTGDASKKIEYQLISNTRASLRSNLLKAGHHGSKTSSADSFVKAVAPEYAIISAGKNNSYWHPHQDVLKTFDSLGIKVLRTDELGTIRFSSNGEALMLDK